MENGLKKEDSLALKGMAILMMVFYHCYYKVAKFQKYDVVFRGFSADQVITVASCMKICVALFAFVSGYGLMYGYKKEKRQKALSQIPGGPCAIFFLHYPATGLRQLWHMQAMRFSSTEVSGGWAMYVLTS